jgi:hypothetical protein
MDDLPHGAPREPAPATPEPSGQAERRRHRRAPVVWMATLRTARGFFECIVIDISSSGARLVISDGTSLAPGEAVTLDLSPCGKFRATAVWKEGDFSGIRFHDAAEVIAAAVHGVPKA